MTETNTSRSATQTSQEPEQDAPVDTPESSQDDGHVAPSEAESTADAVAESEPAAAPRATPAIFTTPVREPGMPEASPDGAWIAYLYPTEDDRRELWLSPVAGGDAVRLELPFEPVDDLDPESGRHIRGPQWSPDGATLALTGLHPDGDRTAVWLVSLETGEVEPVEATETVAEKPAPPAPEPVAASDDAEERNDEGAESESEPNSEGETAEVAPAPAPVATKPIAPAVASARLLSDHPYPSRSPRWSPDGALMLVVMTRDGVDQIGLAQPGLDDVAPMVEPLTSGLLAHREPIWSRDGRFIAFARQHGNDYRFADICTFELQTGEFKNLTGDKEPNIRHSLDWVPGRNLVAFVTRDGDWLGIAVVNADNKAGWMVTREAGDKYGHRLAPDEARLIYIRSEGFSTALVERGLHGSGTIALDPGEGVVTTPIWVAPKVVAYGFVAPQKPLGWLTQENTADAERTVVSLPEMTTARDATLRHPTPFEFEVGPDEQFSGLLYQTEGLSGPVPGAVYISDGPLAARMAGFQREEQALANSGFATLAPVIHGATGFGTAVEDDLADYSDSELEAADLAAAGQALGERDGVDASKLVLVGHGYGGTLALIATGARPGIYRTVVAIDPVTDWSIELDQADRNWRQWVIRQYGLPLTNADRYALRTPETFAGVIDAELVLVSTAVAPAHRKIQMESFKAWLDAVGVKYTAMDLDTATAAETLYELGQELAGRLRTLAEARA